MNWRLGVIFMFVFAAIFVIMNRRSRPKL